MPISKFISSFLFSKMCVCNNNLEFLENIRRHMQILYSLSQENNIYHLITQGFVLRCLEMSKESLGMAHACINYKNLKLLILRDLYND